MSTENKVCGLPLLPDLTALQSYVLSLVDCHLQLSAYEKKSGSRRG
jgi:hypothetical protein